MSKKLKKILKKNKSVEGKEIGKGGYICFGPKVPNAGKMKTITIINMSSKRKAI